LRYFLVFSYFGQPFHGWQRQPNAISVQEVVEEALSTLLRTPIMVYGAGRTDAGVHAKEMYAHFDVDYIENIAHLIHRLNAFLPETIAIINLFKVADTAHSRFDASARTYEYWIVQEKNPFYKDAAFYVKQALDVSQMNKAAQILLQYEDFECFSKSNSDVKTYRCRLDSAVWKSVDDRLVFTITADRFLRNMVRAIVGTLLDIGSGKLGLTDLEKIVESKDRSEAGASVPAKGLYLTRVTYPEKIYN